MLEGERAVNRNDGDSSHGYANRVQDARKLHKRSRAGGNNMAADRQPQAEDNTLPAADDTRRPEGKRPAAPPRSQAMELEAAGWAAAADVCPQRHQHALEKRCRR